MDRGKILQKGDDQEPAVQSEWPIGLTPSALGPKGNSEGRGYRLTSEPQGNIEKRSQFRKCA